MSSSTGGQEPSTNPKLPTWDGDWRTYADYKLMCQLESDGMKEGDWVILAPRLTRNLTGKAWEACVDIDREKLKKADGLEYLLQFLKAKRGKQQVDILGEAFEKYFNSGDPIRLEKETLTDYEQRVSVHFRDIARALQEMGTQASVPTEIYGWLLLNKHIRLEPSDVATVKSQANSYRLDDVWSALRRMWGGDSLTVKDMERRKLKTYMATVTDVEVEGGGEGTGIWWNDADAPEESEAAEDEPPESSDVWFEEALEAYHADPTDGAVYENFQEAKKAFYKDARRALEQHRVNRGFYPGSKGRAKGAGKMKGDAGRGEFRGKCMRCGKVGHKAQHCPQGGGGKGAASGKGAVSASSTPTGRRQKSRRRPSMMGQP